MMSKESVKCFPICLDTDAREDTKQFGGILSVLYSPIKAVLEL